MKTKLTYSQVKKALKAGYVSPLNSVKKVFAEFVGMVFEHGKNNQQWEVTSAECIKQYPHAAQSMIDGGKDAIHYFARKVLKSGKVSKQCGMFYRVTRSGSFIKVL